MRGYVGESVTIGYDPRDITEIRVFHRNRFLCRAVSPDHANQAISLKDIEYARAARRRALRDDISTRRRAVTDFLRSSRGDEAADEPIAANRLALYDEGRQS